MERGKERRRGKGGREGRSLPLMRVLLSGLLSYCLSEQGIFLNSTDFFNSYSCFDTSALCCIFKLAHTPFPAKLHIFHIFLPWVLLLVSIMLGTIIITQPKYYDVLTSLLQSHLAFAFNFTQIFRAQEEHSHLLCQNGARVASSLAQNSPQCLLKPQSWSSSVWPVSAKDPSVSASPVPGL